MIFQIPWKSLIQDPKGRNCRGDMYTYLMCGGILYVFMCQHHLGEIGEIVIFVEY